MATSTLPPRVARRPEFAGILRDEVTYASEGRAAAGGREPVSERVNGAFDRLMLQSGLDVGPPMMLALSVCSAVLFGGAAFVVQENLLTTALGAVIGAMVPVLITLFVRSRRQ